MYGLLRFSGAVKHDPDVDAWLSSRPQALGAIARKWFERMRQSGPDVRELVHDGCPVACVGDAPFAYVNVFSAHVNVGFYHGADLEDPLSLLEGSGKRMRHVKIKPLAEPDEAGIRALLDAAYTDIKDRLQ